ncbi:MAG TPA: ATP-binding cassette domain-containing protein, partial [Candidatus Limnocylindrales bacterium]|nr:ATP-binding cassette domain-containing protein [Candidatus Limnocylindrales bacterium]
DLERVYPRKSANLGEPVMRVRSLGSEAFREVSFDLRAGEILGVFGLLGSGCGELVRGLYGALLAGTGSIEVGSTSGLFRSPAAARHAGVGLIPLDRKQDGLVLGMDISSNLTLGTAGRYTRSGFLRRRLEDARATEWVKRLTIRTPSVRQQVRLLSGGNQQKVVIARWLEAGARVLVMDEPTRGVDVGARVDIYRILEELAEKGVGIVMSSTDLSEVASLSDRILVLHRGRVVALLEREDFDQETLLSLALGGQAA